YIVMHAISLPELQRKVLALLKSERNSCTPAQLAMLEDRILVFSGKKQIYGTQFDWDKNGVLNPFPIEHLGDVDSRRKQVGLPPLSETVVEHRDRANREGERAPANFAVYTKLREDWMLKVGWIRDRSEIDSAFYS
ncbi:MAG: DUF6624 domain-containing protein, partial [Candidatus Kapaibacterium sp.]